MMRRIAIAAILLTSGNAWAAECVGKGPVGYVCNTPRAEDMVAVPDSNWIVTSGLAGDKQPGALYLIDRAKKTASVLFGKTPAADKHDTGAYPGCAGAADPQTFSAHGVSLRKGTGGVHTLYVMNHSKREAVEVFELDASKAQPALAWKGCVILPAGSTGNGVAPLPDGGLAVTIMASPEYFGGKTAGQEGYMAKFRTGETTGHVATWTAAGGWKKVPGTEGSGPNGLESSADGRWLWIAMWPRNELVRAPLREGGTRSVVKLDLMPDNLRWGDDGQLYAAGAVGSVAGYFECWAKPGCKNDFAVAKIDPQSLAVTLVPHPETRPDFADVTSALKVGNEIWLGSYPSDRVAYLQLSK